MLCVLKHAVYSEGDEGLGKARQEQTCGLVVLALHCTAKLAVVPGSNLTVEASRLKSGWPTKRAVYTIALLPWPASSMVLTCLPAPP